MTNLPFDAALVALKIVQVEANSGTTPEALTEATERALDKMQHALTALLGSGGVRSLMWRALKVAQRVHPELADVTIDTQPDMVLTGLSAALSAAATNASESPPDHDISTIASSILNQLICLLVSLLGEEIGMIAVRRTWSGVAREFAPSRSTETE